MSQPNDSSAPINPSRDIPDRTKPLTTYPNEGEFLSVPKKPCEKRTISKAWDRQYSDFSPKELDDLRNQVGDQLKTARKRLKRHHSMDAEYWDAYGDVVQLTQQDSQITSQKRLDDTLANKEEASDWYNTEEAQQLEQRYNSWAQLGAIMKQHQHKLEGRLASYRESWVRLFISSKLGFGLATKEMGAGARDTQDQRKFKKALIQAMCPHQASETNAWDPVLRDWFSTKIIKAAHLFPYAQGMFMDDIFGKFSSRELFSPLNGLLLHEDIKYALGKGWVAIVPDIELEPADPSFPANDQEQRRERVKTWEKCKVKAYKMIVLSTKDPKMTAPIFVREKYGVSTIAELDGRSLEFRTNFRPRARYIWWTYLNAIIRNSWAQGSKDDNTQHLEVQKGTRYWGSRASYVKENQLLGFIEEVGHDVESILNFDREKATSKPRYEAVRALAGQLMIEGEGEDDEWETTSEEGTDSESEE